MIAAIICDEINNTATKQVLFRANSIASKALDFYQKLVCGEWLAKLLRLIDTIAQDEVLPLSFLPFILYSSLFLQDHSCEVVQSKMTPEDSLDANLKLLTGHITTAITAITENKALCPASLRTIYHAMFESSQKKFLDDVDVRYTAVSGFLFLRLFVPSIMTPKLFGLLDAFVEGHPSRTFTLVATVLQKLGNLQEFEPREANLDKLNPWMKEQMPKFKAFMDFICTESAEAPANPEADLMDYDSHMASIYRHLTTNLPYFQAQKGTSTTIAAFLDECSKLSAEFVDAPKLSVLLPPLPPL